MDIAIVGAGITGLAAAISLRRSGHRVTIYERSSLANEVGAAINVPPNVARFLIPWGLDPVRHRFVKTPGMYFMSHETLEPLPAVTDHSRNTELFGAPLFYAHRVDLVEALRELATDPSGPGLPAEIHLRSEVRSYDTETPSITLASGAIVKADLVVAADGVHSIGVEHVLGRPNSSEVPSFPKVNLCYRFLIPKTSVDDDPDTRFFNEDWRSRGCRLWVDIAGKKRVISYPCRNYEVLNFINIIRDEQVVSSQEDWLASVDKSEVLDKWSNFHPKLLAVMNKATEVKRWPLLYRPPISTWHKDRMVLAGDAAHPMLPHHAQGGAQGIEDGLALGLALHGVTDASQIGERLVLYETIRRGRASAIQIMSNYGFDEEAPEELLDFLEGQPIPSTCSVFATSVFAVAPASRALFGGDSKAD
ncbi:FAD binding domain-containing protein [Lasiosphaeria miniovina]|uniref:FAD binding domain-containing protein n=1 Tax=Lasiosphaeria miniovina TaxID=1954250 RepID=A0AA40A676_9PEZI|nr:FAD binding domain-containing protein [Lasiosphaeria miniovina]KAK0710064.1 FAD binding domain-containing protein [Lasiosphaeria miniovina]